MNDTFSDGEDDDDIDFDSIEREAKDFANRVYGDYSGFQAALLEDVRRTRQILSNEDSQFARRIYLRSFFAFVDGILFGIRHIVYEYTKTESDSPVPNILSDAERMLLQEVVYELTDNGGVKIRYPNFQPLLKLLRFTFVVYSRFRRTTGIPNYGGSGWQSFRDAVDVRHRITHPKKTDDLHISDEDLRNILAARNWFFESLNAVHRSG